MQFTFIAVFKNRDQKRVGFFIESLQQQSNQDFELLFINQGSDAHVNQWLEKLLAEYRFINYYHNRTEGFLWNKSNALNIGIKAAKGEYIIIADIDLVFPPDYLTKIGNILLPGLFLTHNSFYIPETFHINKISQLINQQYDDLFVENFNGACVVKRDVLINLRGYDEFYLVWGAEDDDLMRRLEDFGLLRKHICTSEINIYHQWHPSRSPGKPTAWYLIMVNHLFSIKHQQYLNTEWGARHEFKDRPVLNLIANQDYKQETRLEFESDRSLFFFNLFINQFHQLKIGEIAYLDYTSIAQSTDKKRSFSFISKPKSKSSKNERITKKDISQFFQYFIGCNRPLMQDYYYEESENNFLFVCVK